MGVPKEIGHIVLNVTDVERSTRFYRDVVGFQVSRYRPDGTGAFLTCGVVHHNLALFKAPAGARPAEKGAVGLNHFAFKVESYQALQERCPPANIDELTLPQLKELKTKPDRRPDGTEHRWDAIENQTQQ